MKLTPKQIKQIHTLRAKGMTERAIAEKVGCSRTTVNTRLRQAQAADLEA